jgi:hypothetical protein
MVRLSLRCGNSQCRTETQRTHLTMMYEGIRGALAADDAIERDHREPPFRVRETSDWKKHAADLEAEMLKRGMMFEVIDWSVGQIVLPL